MRLSEAPNNSVPDSASKEGCPNTAPPAWNRHRSIRVLASYATTSPFSSGTTTRGLVSGTNVGGAVAPMEVPVVAVRANRVRFHVSGEDSDVVSDTVATDGNATSRPAGCCVVRTSTSWRTVDVPPCSVVVRPSTNPMPAHNVEMPSSVLCDGPSPKTVVFVIVTQSSKCPKGVSNPPWPDTSASYV